MDKLIDVVAVEPVGRHVLRLSFEDGLVGDADFSSRRWHGVSEPLSDPAFFAKAYVDPELGTVAWPNGYDIAPETLYQRASEHPVRNATSNAAA